MSGAPNITCKARELGAIAVLRKPIELQSFLRIIDDFD